MWLHGLAAFALLVGGHPALAALAIVPALAMADGPFGVLRVLWRLRRVRRAMRAKHVHVAPIHWGLAYAAHLSRCDRCTTVEPRCQTGRMLRAGRIERAGVVYTATTFPAIAAYRELARTGDVEAFAARDTRPVTVEYTLQAMDDGAAEVTELELSDEARAGLQVRRETLGEVK
jgi:hypothetical protein